MVGLQNGLRVLPLLIKQGLEQTGGIELLVRIAAWQRHVLHLARLGNGIVPAPGLCSLDHGAEMRGKKT